MKFGKFIYFVLIGFFLCCKFELGFGDIKIDRESFVWRSFGFNGRDG